MSVKERVKDAVSNLIESLGYELVEVVYKKQYDGMSLTIFIDNEKGISLDDCELVSNAIDPVLEELNPTDDKPYTLNISSPGIDRPLKTNRELEKKLGQEIEISLYKASEGKKNFTGVLAAFDEESITITNNGEIKFLRKDIAVARPVVKF